MFDELENIDETDPIKVILEIDKRIRPEFNEVKNTGHYEIVIAYAAAIRRACEVFDVPIDLPPHENEGAGALNSLLYRTKLAVDLKKFDLLYLKVQHSQSVVLDENWRSKIHSYIANIRPIVEKASIPQGLRDSIFDKLNLLEAEVDRSRTRTQVFSDALVEISKALGMAAKELQPVAVLVARIVGAIARLHDGAGPMLALPPPEGLGLDDDANSSLGRTTET